MRSRDIIIIILLACAVACAHSAEKKLAGITLGMKPAEVIEMLGNPSAILLAQPPVITRTVSSGALTNPLPGLVGTAENMIPEADRPNTLVLIYRDPKTKIDYEIEIGASEDPTMNNLSGMGSSMGSSSSPSSGSKEAVIPVWAYVVRATKLSLGQQELIYQVNDTFSLGVTITGSGAEAKVTDIVACSFQPFQRTPNNPAALNDRKAVNFKYSAAEDPKKRTMSLWAGTSKRVVIGSRITEVLTNHGWPQFFFPYVTDSIAKIVLSKPAVIPKITVKPGGSSLSPASAPIMPTDSGMLGPMAAGDKPITLTDGDKFNMQSGFTKNALMLFLDDDVAFTLVDFTVVRIQIGSGVVKPPEPPKISTPTPGVPPANP